VGQMTFDDISELENLRLNKVGLGHCRMDAH
jgi:hypothetical protein